MRLQIHFGPNFSCTSNKTNILPLELKSLFSGWITVESVSLSFQLLRLKPVLSILCRGLKTHKNTYQTVSIGNWKSLFLSLSHLFKYRYFKLLKSHTSFILPNSFSDKWKSTYFSKNIKNCCCCTFLFYIYL